MILHMEHIPHTPAGGLTLGSPPPPRGPLPYMGTHPNTSPFQVHNSISGRGMLYTMDTHTPPSTDVREALMGFRVEDTAVPGLSESQRVQLVGQFIDLNTMTWTISKIRSLTLPVERGPRGTPSPTYSIGTSCLASPCDGHAIPPAYRGSHTPASDAFSADTASVDP